MGKGFYCLLALAIAVGSVACLGRTEIRGVETTGLDRKLSTFAFIEEGDIVSFIVSTRATRNREKSAFIPLEVCVANRGLKTLTLTRESFILFDEQGNRYHSASPRDLMEAYNFLDQDRGLGDLPEIVFNRFAVFNRYPSSFSPTRMRGRRFGSGTVRDRVSLPRFGFMIDFIYFPMPTTGLLDHKFELHLEAEELPHTIFVKFMVL